MAGETSKEKLEVLLTIRDMATHALKRFEANTGQAAKKSESHFAKSEAAVDRLRRGIVRMGVALATVFAARKVVQSIVDFEQGLVGVGKTADISGAALEGLGEQFIGLSRTIPVGVGQLLEIGRAAGQLGVQGAPNILKFTETVARLAAASADFQGEEAATTLARFLTVTGEGVQDVDRLASVVTDLGNKTAATEREIALAGLSVGQATAIFNIGAANAAAFGAALSQLGVQTDLAGSTIGRTFRAIDAALREQGKGAEVLVQITGKSVEELANIFRTDAVAGFQVFLKGLQNVVESGGDATKVLEALNIADIRIQKVLPVLSKNYDLLAQKLGEAGREWQANQALIKESDRAFGTLGGSLRKLGNTLEASILKLGNTRGALGDLVGTATAVIEQFFGLESSVARPTVAVVALTSALRVATAALVGFVTVKALTFLAELYTGLKKVAAGLLGIGTAAKANPIIAVVSAIATGATALALFSTHAAAATESTKRYAESVEKAGAALDRLAVLERSRQLGDVQKEFDSLEAIVRRLGTALDEVTARRKGGKRITFGELIGIEPAVEGSKEFQAVIDRLRGTTAVPPSVPVSPAQSGLQRAYIDATRAARDETVDFDTAIKILEDTIARYKGLLEDLKPRLRDLHKPATDDAGKATAAFDKIVAGLQNERRALEFSKEDQDEATVVRRYGLQLMKLEGSEFDAQFDRLVQHVKKNRELREALAAVTEALAKRRAEEERLAGLGFKQGFTSVVSQFDDAAERLSILGESVAQGMLDVFTIEFFDPMTGRFKSLEDIARSTLLNIANAIQRVISQQIALAAVSGIGGALKLNLAKPLGLGQGGVLDSGRLVKAQQGVVVNAPTVISSGNGPGVLAGEARQPEGVFPLVRDKSGDLGVRAVGGGGGNTISLTYAPVIQTQSGTDNNALAQLLRNDFDRQMSRWFVGQMARGTPVRRSVIEGVKKG